MLDMSLTLDVSKFSGWLNANAPCRVGREGIQKGRHAGRERGGRGTGRCASSVQGRVQLWGLEGRARSARRTWWTWL